MDLNHFSWVIPKRLAGSPGPDSIDDLIFLRQKGIKHLVRLAEPSKAHVTKEDVFDAGLDDFHEPIKNYSAPSQEQIERIVQAVKPWVEKGEPVAVSCGYGLGRTGTILACILLYLCHSYEEAVEIVSERNLNQYGFNQAWETNDQMLAVRQIARKLGKLK